jgi:hypothetical protein
MARILCALFGKAAGLQAGRLFCFLAWPANRDGQA